MNHMQETEVTENVAPIHSESVEVTANVPAAEHKPTNNKRIKSAQQAASKDSTLAGLYCAITTLNMRHGAGMSEKIMTIIPKSTKVRSYGFYTDSDDCKWLYVQVALNNVVYSGFCSSKYLEKI